MTPAATAKSEAVKQRQSDLLKSVQKEQEPPAPKDPPPEFEFIADPPSISGFLQLLNYRICRSIRCCKQVSQISFWCVGLKIPKENPLLESEESQLKVTL